VSDLPRLLFCCFEVVPGPSATSRRLSEYVKGLSERFQVVVLSVKTADHPHIEKYHGARLLRVPVGAGDLTARLEAFDRAVRRQLESEDYMLVHFFDPFGGHALAEKRGEYQYKLVYDACVFPSIELPFASPEPAAYRRLITRARRQELFCLMNADAVVVGNPLTRDWLATLGVERDQVHVLHAPVDLVPYAQTERGHPDGATMNVLHLGSLHGSHGLPLLLEAVARARSAVALKLTVVGPPNPEWRARLVSQAQALGLGGELDLQDPVGHDDLHKVLASADVGALTLADAERSRIVGSPLSRLGEYLAAGRPVLAADTPCSRHLVPEDAAVWYRPGDLASLTQALVKLGADVSLRLALGEAARGATARWDAAKIRADLVALYSRVTGTRAPRALDDERVDPNEVTQLGRSRLVEAGDVTEARRLQAAGGEEASLGANQVVVASQESGANRIRTDPAIQRSDSSTDASARAQPPAVMGVPLREEPAALPVIPPLPTFGPPGRRPLPPPVPSPSAPSHASASRVSAETLGRLVGELTAALPESEAPSARPLHAPPAPSPQRPWPRGDASPPAPEPGALAPRGPGSELDDDVPEVGEGDLEEVVPREARFEPPAAPGQAPPPGLDPAPRPDAVAAGPGALAAAAAGLRGHGPGARPEPRAGASSPSGARLVAPPPLPPPGRLVGQPTPPPFTLGERIAPGVFAPPALRQATPPALPVPPVARSPALPGEPPPSRADEAVEISDAEVQAVEAPGADGEVVLAAEEVDPVDTDSSPPPSAIDPWLAQLVHGYCPPGSHLFDRPVPPTTTPGRDRGGGRTD
jgi:glycosyltransferase involved in cell wall biosynthesis